MKSLLLHGRTGSVIMLSACLLLTLFLFLGRNAHASTLPPPSTPANLAASGYFQAANLGVATPTPTSNTSTRVQALLALILKLKAQLAVLVAARSSQHSSVQPTGSPSSLSPSTFSPSQNPSQTSAHFAGTQESTYALPDTYPQIRQYLVEQLIGPNSFDNVFLNVPLGTTAGASTCNGSVTIQYYQGPRDWPDIARAAELFRSGSIITKGDPEYPALSSQLRAKFLSLADYLIENANATYFYNDTTPGRIGWNPFGSPWDAWDNGTCSPASAPTVYASYEALTAIADAYIATHDPKYLTAFINGSAFWNGGFWPQEFRQYDLATEQQIRAKAASYGPYEIASTYTVGGSRFSPSKVADQLVIRYHYFADDPGYFAVNSTSGMGLAMTLGGVGSPYSSYTFPDGSGGTVERSFSNIGYYAMLGVAGNLEARNYGYTDLDYVYHATNDYEAHIHFPLYELARAGFATNNASFKATAREAALDIIDTVSPVKLQDQSNDIYFCLVRQLDPQLLDFCKKTYQRVKNSSGISFYTVWPIINVLETDTTNTVSYEGDGSTQSLAQSDQSTKSSLSAIANVLTAVQGLLAKLRGQ